MSNRYLFPTAVDLLALIDNPSKGVKVPGPDPSQLPRPENDTDAAAAYDSQCADWRKQNETYRVELVAAILNNLNLKP
eukprot:6197731-Amphidinium_carterae.1